MKQKTARRWYITSIAYVYLIIYTYASIWYIHINLTPGAFISPVRQVLTAALALSALLYVVRTPVGHISMIVCSLVALSYCLAEADMTDARFFGIMTFLLLLPLLRNSVHRQSRDKRLEGNQLAVPTS